MPANTGRRYAKFIQYTIRNIARDSSPLFMLSNVRAKMIEPFGSCKCGQVQYKVSNRALQVVACHCRMCRSMTGAPLSSYVVVKEEHFAVTSGHEVLSSYAVSDRTKRYFCATCGTPIFNSNPHTYKGLAMLYLGTVADHENIVPELSIYCEGKLPWVNIHESSKSFPQAPTRGA